MHFCQKHTPTIHFRGSANALAQLWITIWPMHVHIIMQHADVRKNYYQYKHLRRRRPHPSAIIHVWTCHERQPSALTVRDRQREKSERHHSLLIRCTNIINTNWGAKHLSLMSTKLFTVDGYAYVYIEIPQREKTERNPSLFFGYTSVIDTIIAERLSHADESLHWRYLHLLVSLRWNPQPYRVPNIFVADYTRRWLCPQQQKLKSLVLLVPNDYYAPLAWTTRVMAQQK